MVGRSARAAQCLCVCPEKMQAASLHNVTESASISSIPYSTSGLGLQASACHDAARLYGWLELSTAWYLQRGHSRVCACTALQSLHHGCYGSECCIQCCVQWIFPVEGCLTLSYGLVVRVKSPALQHMHTCVSAHICKYTHANLCLHSSSNHQPRGYA